MLQAQKVIRWVYSKLQQQFSTSFNSEEDILDAINSAKDYICLYCDRSRTLTVSEVGETAQWSKTYQLPFHIIKPMKIYGKTYDSWGDLEWWVELSPSNALNSKVEWDRVCYISWKDITTSESFYKISVLYHRIEEDVIDQKWSFNIPPAFKTPMQFIALGILRVGWYEQWAELSNKSYLDTDKWLSPFKSMYQHNIWIKWFRPWVPWF